jgi:hypothetical protein
VEYIAGMYTLCVCMFVCVSLCAYDSLSFPHFMLVCVCVECWVSKAYKKHEK